MKQYEKYAETALSVVTYPIRLCVGLYNAVERHMPSTLECNYEVKKKGYDIVRKKEDKSGTKANS
jgi:hypothetical protein